MNTIKEDISPQKINIKKKRVYWTVKKDKLLLELVKSNGVKLNWKELTANFNMTFKQCYDRYININPLLKKGSWSDEEERKLKGLVGIYGEKWSQISKEFGGTRSGKQIRFHCKHMPELNGKKWSFLLATIRDINCMFRVNSCAFACSSFEVKITLNSVELISRITE